MSTKHLKEAFVSNLSGTGITEISLGLIIASLCFLFRGLLLICFYTKHSINKSWRVSFLFDFIVLIVPLVLSCTVFSSYLYVVSVSIATLCMLVFHSIYRRTLTSSKTSLNDICQAFLNAQVENGPVPAVADFRIFLNVLTAISILAVDFPAFPRRYAKTETYGTGVMDMGVGGFIFGNALVSPEARIQVRGTGSTFSTVKKQVLSVWPLVVLGLGRLISVKAVDYHEHVSEYGVHWNFFFTLAAVRVMSSLLLILVPPQKSYIIAAMVISSYQILLELTDLMAFILHGSDGQGSRSGFLNANREGIFSVIGYLGIYMTGVQVGLHVLRRRRFVKEWLELTWILAILSSLFFLSTAVFQSYMEPVSRRMANFPFCTWIVGQSLAWVCLFLLCDLLLALAKYMTPGSNLPCTWNVCSATKAPIRKATTVKEEVPLCLIEAINRNQLLFFLLSNVLTGIVNMTIDTIHCSDCFSLFMLILYMCTNCFIIYMLHINNITIKFW
ncbi:phosphatidylinositol-glycan biosynthesis class W protein [Hyperolius riggenbachi]|uniref:phosphatidylinositol-glycan biosynthesis class W protein n=1 Tax=Hyperolius riggenbachi TaxID=752182 RepID=UPI0035A34735